MPSDDTGALVATGSDRVADRHERLELPEVLESRVETQFEGDHDVDDLWVLARRS